MGAINSHPQEQMSMAPLGPLRLSARISLDAVSILLDVPLTDLFNVNYYCKWWFYSFGIAFSSCIALSLSTVSEPVPTVDGFLCGHLFCLAATLAWQTFIFLFLPRAISRRYLR